MAAITVFFLSFSFFFLVGLLFSQKSSNLFSKNIKIKILEEFEDEKYLMTKINKIKTEVGHAKMITSPCFFLSYSF
jgi:hypothetical protein